MVGRAILDKNKLAIVNTACLIEGAHHVWSSITAPNCSRPVLVYQRRRPPQDESHRMDLFCQPFYIAHCWRLWLAVAAAVSLLAFSHFLHLFTTLRPHGVAAPVRKLRDYYC
jgi:hypothetical protein